jgi:hypothetical protein
MPTFLKVIIWIAVGLAIVMFIGTVGKSDKDFVPFGALMFIVWGVCAFVYALRGIYRFITK